jgi:hypothetical protein
LRLELRKPWADGTTAFVLSPLDFIAKARRCNTATALSHDEISRRALVAQRVARPLVIPNPAPAVSVAPLQLSLFAPLAPSASSAPAPAGEFRG